MSIVLEKFGDGYILTGANYKLPNPKIGVKFPAYSFDLMEMLTASMESRFRIGDYLYTDEPGIHEKFLTYAKNINRYLENPDNYYVVNNVRQFIQFSGVLLYELKGEKIIFADSSDILESNVDQFYNYLDDHCRLFHRVRKSELLDYLRKFPKDSGKVAMTADSPIELFWFSGCYRYEQLSHGRFKCWFFKNPDTNSYNFTATFNNEIEAFADLESQCVIENQVTLVDFALFFGSRNQFNSVIDHEGDQKTGKKETKQSKIRKQKSKIRKSFHRLAKIRKTIIKDVEKLKQLQGDSKKTRIDGIDRMTELANAVVSRHSEINNREVFNLLCRSFDVRIDYENWKYIISKQHGFDPELELRS